MPYRLRAAASQYTLLVALACLAQAARGQSPPQSPAAQSVSHDDATDIVITARRAGTTDKIDRTVYDIETGADAASSSTTDVLKRLPGVTIGPSNRVSIRGGARVGYLVDGKPVRPEIALAIPAGQIQRVEIIANPSAEFDSGNEALFNLILRRTAGAGWSGSASAKADSLGGFRAGVDVARGGGAWAVNGNVSFRSERLKTQTLRTTKYLPTPDDPGFVQTLAVDNAPVTNRLSGQVKFSRDSEKSNSTSIVLGSSFSRIPQHEDVVELTSGAGDDSPRVLRRSLDFEGAYPFANIAVNRKLSSDLELRTSLDAFAGAGRDRRRTTGQLTQRIAEDLTFRFVESGATIARSFKTGELLIGSMVSTNPVVTDLRVSGTALPSGTVEQNSNFHFNRNKYAGFVSYEGRILGLDLKPAIRFEQITQEFSDRGRAIAGLRGIHRILPSLHVAKKIGKKSTIKASFTTRTEEPDAVNLNPSRRFLSPFFIEQGNTFLSPSTKRLVDLSYVYEQPHLSVGQSLYYRDTKDDISSFVFSDSAGVTTSSFTNLGASETYGYSGSLKARLIKGLEVGGGIDVFHRHIVAPITLDTLGSIAFYAANVNGTADYTINPKNSISLHFSYEGRTRDLGIETPSFATSEVQYTRKLSKSVTLNVLLADFAVSLDRVGRFDGIAVEGTERSRRGSRLIRIGIASTL